MENLNFSFEVRRHRDRVILFSEKFYAGLGSSLKSIFMNSMLILGPDPFSLLSHSKIFHPHRDVTILQKELKNLDLCEQCYKGKGYTVY